jgi:hypothetical protein
VSWIGERGLFRAGVALFALHLVDDGFVHPEPGTGAGDHLFSTGIPLALLGAAVIVQPRLRPALRASVAFVLAILAVGIAIGVHIAQAVLGPFGGDHWTGLLLLPAAAAFGAAAWIALRQAPRRRWRRRALLTFAWILGVYSLVLPVVAAYVITHKPRKEPGIALGTPVRLQTSDGLELGARYLPSRNGAAVLLFPGRVAHARMLARHGYGVLLADMRGNGTSEGDANAFGWDSKPDIDAAVAFLRARPDVDDGRVGGIGFSVGGEMLLTAAAQGTGLHAVVSEGAGVRSLHEELLRLDVGGVLALPFSATMLGATRVFTGDRPPEPLDELVPRISPRPILLIEAGHGQGGEDLNGLYYRRAREPKAYWHIDEAGHTGGLDTRPNQYERRVVGFFVRALRRG